MVDTQTCEAGVTLKKAKTASCLILLNPVAIIMPKAGGGLLL
jgi:hypothetical protein